MIKREEPLVSIITPCYNASKYIGKTIESVLNQTYTNFEMIIVDDISTDDSYMIIKKYVDKDARIKYIKLEEKGGASISRNQALKEAKGKYVAFLDSDDLWHNEKLEKQVKFMEKNNINFSYTDYEYIDENDRKLNVIRKCPQKVTYNKMLLGDSVGCLTVMYNREKTGLIEIPKLDKRNDYALWCRVLKKVKVGYKLDDKLAFYRKNTNSISSGSKIKLLKYHYELHRKVNGFNPVSSGLLTMANTIKYIYIKRFSEKKIFNKVNISLVGHFAKDKDFNDGQTVKIRNLYYELCKLYGEQNIEVVDTYNWKKYPLKLLIRCIQSLQNSKNIIVLPARNGVKVFIPLFAYFNKKYKRNLIYAVVGGWIPDVAKNKKYLLDNLKLYNHILVETSSMKERLDYLGLKNVDILYNFKLINVLNVNELKNTITMPIKLCTFSRVIREKGIENAANAVEIANSKLNLKAFELDIYGPVGKEYEIEFNEVLKKYKSAIYKGVVDAQKSVDVLKTYHFLLFPTYYSGEGFAGTIIDAYSSGVPVIASDWKYNKDVVIDKETGFLFETKNDLMLSNILIDIYNNKYDIWAMKKKCLSEAKRYMPDEAIKGLTKYII